MKPLNKHIILKEVLENKTFKGIIIPKQIAANQATFAQIIALPDEQINTNNFHVGQYVVLGYSPIWEKKYKHRYNNEDYLIIDEYSILETINDDDAKELLDIAQ